MIYFPSSFYEKPPSLDKQGVFASLESQVKGVVRVGFGVVWAGRSWPIVGVLEINLDLGRQMLRCPASYGFMVASWLSLTVGARFYFERCG